MIAGTGKSLDPKEVAEGLLSTGLDEDDEAEQRMMQTLVVGIVARQEGRDGRIAMIEHVAKRDQKSDIWRRSMLLRIGIGSAGRMEVSL